MKKVSISVAAHALKRGEAVWLYDEDGYLWGMSWDYSCSMRQIRKKILRWLSYSTTQDIFLSE